jgi:hypothetical protein
VIGYSYIDRPPPMEGIWYCEPCMMYRPFCTLQHLTGKDVPDAPLFCDECDWEMPVKVDVVAHYPEPPAEMRRTPDPTLPARIAKARAEGTLAYRGADGEAELMRLEAEHGWRAAGKERWRRYLLSISSPRSMPGPEPAPMDEAALAQQIEQLQGERGRRVA